MSSKEQDSLSRLGMKPDEKQRLELLKQQKELQRREREQAIWRKASSLPKPAASTPEQLRGGEHPGDLPKPPKQITGLFAKLKLGKFLE